MIINKNPKRNQYSQDPEILRKVPIVEEVRDKIVLPKHIKTDINIEEGGIAQTTQAEELRRPGELLIHEKAKSKVKRNNITEQWVVRVGKPAATEESLEEMAT